MASEWKQEWKGMPEFIQEDLRPYRTIHVHFKNEEDVQKFAKMIDQKITLKQKALWVPPVTLRICSDKRYVDEP